MCLSEKISNSASIKSGILAVLAGVLTFGCDTGEPFSLFDEDYESGEQPVVNQIDPEGRYVAGVDKITLYGEHFSPEADRNLVYFNEDRGEVLEAAEDQLVVRPSNTPGDSVMVRVSVRGAEKFSEMYEYELTPSIQNFNDFADFFASSAEPWANTVDSDGNLLATINADGYHGLFRFDVSELDEWMELDFEGEHEDYLVAPINNFNWRDIKVGPDGLAYLVRNERTVERVDLDPDLDEDESIFAFFASGNFMGSLEFDEYGHLWSAGNADSIYRLDIDEDDFNESIVYSKEWDANTRALRYVDGRLYVASQIDGSTDIYSFEVTGDGELTDEKLVFSLADDLGEPAASIFSLEADSEGNLYAGSDLDDPVIRIHQDGSWEKYYPGVFDPAIISFGWGAEDNLFVTREEFGGNPQRLQVINMQRQRSTYYGID